MKLVEMGDPGRTAAAIREEMTQAVGHSHFAWIGPSSFTGLLDFNYPGEFANVVEYIEYIKKPQHWGGGRVWNGSYG